MDRQEELRQWFAIAEEDLGVAKHLATMYRPTPLERICNLCQQSAEKDLKGYLFLNRVEFQKTHDLRILLTMCTNLNPDFAQFVPCVLRGIRRDGARAVSTSKQNFAINLMIIKY